MWLFCEACRLPLPNAETKVQETGYLIFRRLASSRICGCPGRCKTVVRSSRVARRLRGPELRNFRFPAPCWRSTMEEHYGETDDGDHGMHHESHALQTIKGLRFRRFTHGGSLCEQPAIQSCRPPSFGPRQAAFARGTPRTTPDRWTGTRR